MGVPPDLYGQGPPQGGGGIPPEIMAALSGGGGQEQAPQQNPLETLQEVIQMIPSVMAALPDAKDTQDMAKCLMILTGIQTRMMGNGPQGPS